jgi:hypothetical protein
MVSTWGAREFQIVHPIAPMNWYARSRRARPALIAQETSGDLLSTNIAGLCPPMGFPRQPDTGPRCLLVVPELVELSVPERELRAAGKPG